MPNQQQINLRPGAYGATIEVVQEKEHLQVARMLVVIQSNRAAIFKSPATDANPQTKRGRGRPRKVGAANVTIIEKVQRKEQLPASSDENSQTRRVRGRPRKVASANGTIIEKVKKVPENEKSHSASSKDVGCDTEHQSGNILDSVFDNLASFEDFSRFLDEQENVDNSPLASLYALTGKISSVMRELTVKGPLIIPPELCQKEKIGWS